VLQISIFYIGGGPGPANIHIDTPEYPRWLCQLVHLGKQQRRKADAAYVRPEAAHNRGDPAPHALLDPMHRPAAWSLAPRCSQLVSCCRPNSHFSCAIYNCSPRQPMTTHIPWNVVTEPTVTKEPAPTAYCGHRTSAYCELSTNLAVLMVRWIRASRLDKFCG
jgi:hypothetical protein